MPEYFLALSAAIFWAISTQFINRGLQEIPESNRREWVATGLFVSMFFGFLTLTPIAINLEKVLDTNINIVLSGIFTFPLATGIYYLTSDKFSKRSEFASVFSRIKPLFSFVVAFLILDELVNKGTIIAIAFVVIGILVLFLGIRLKQLNKEGVFLGIFTALLWSIGEYFMKEGIGSINPILATWVALLSGLVVYSISIPILTNYKIFSLSREIKRMWPFAVHGILSFGIAYSLFFDSISKIGVGKTVLIASFWPIFGLIIGAINRIKKGKSPDIPLTMIIASIFILLGSVIEILNSMN